MGNEAFLSQRYIPGLTVEGYFNLVTERFPSLSKILWFDRPESKAALATLSTSENEFETDTNEGRGDSYRRAQQNKLVRERGIRSLLSLAAGVADLEQVPVDWTMLDLLGGEGLLARVSKTMMPHVVDPIITSDMSGHMIAQALRDDLIAIRQQAQFLFLRDKSVDAALIAYGAHHIPRNDRHVVCQEATRVLLPGGKLVLHDFEEGSPVAMWFSEVVHNYCRAGHPYPHFTREDMERHLRLSGLRSITVRRVYDPLVTRGGSAAEARASMADYLADMYGLVEFESTVTSRDDIRRTVWKLAQNYFVYHANNGPEDAGIDWKQEPVVYRDNGDWVAEVPRVALVADGKKDEAPR